MSNRLTRALLLAVVAASLSGCGARWAYRQGQAEAKEGNWDMAVARLTRALQKDPDNIRYRIALDQARVRAGREHAELGRKHAAAAELEQAAEELSIAVNYDPANQSVAEELEIVQGRIKQRDADKSRAQDFDAMKARAQAYSPLPVLSPRSTAPITLNFPNQSLEKVFESLGKIAGINILFDPDFRDKQTRVQLTGVSFEEALEQLTFANRLFYKVLDRNTLIIVPESQAKRRVYDDVLLRVFYIQNAEVKEVEAVLKTALGPQAKVASNPTLAAINIVGTLDELALAERIIEANDKARGEVLVEVEIMEVNRTRLKDYGIALSNYQARVDFAPSAAPSAADNAITQVRAHLLSSINLSDFVVNVPQSLLTRFLQTDSNVHILASPRLRAAEGKKTSLKIGTEVPVPVTTFQSASATPGQTFAPATSFQYRNVGVTLELTPRVSPAGDIVLEMAAEFSLPGGVSTIGGQDLPSFLTRTVSGVLRVRDGERVMVGGLLQEQETQALSGVLGLQDIPVLNRIFTKTTRKRDQTEILISLTPHLVRAPHLVDSDMQALLVGSKETVRVSGARPPLFGIEEPAPAATPSPSPTPAAGQATPAPPTGPTIGHPPGTVSPGLPPVGSDAMPPSPAPVAVPTPLPPPTVAPPPPPPVEAPQAPPSEAPAEGGSPAVPLPATPSPAPTPVPSPPTSAASSAAPSSARLSTAGLTPPQGRLKVGETSDVAVVVTNVRDLAQVEVVISFDPAVVEVANVRAGTLMTLDGAPVSVDQSAEPGRVRARLARASGVSGSGMAVAVSFRGRAAGASRVRVESMALGVAGGVQSPAVAEATQLTVTQ